MEISTNYGTQPSSYGAEISAETKRGESLQTEVPQETKEAIESKQGGNTSSEPPAMAAEALKAAGLKANEQNLKLVAMLLQNELPINKEALASLTRITQFAGIESAENALFLMKNDIPLTLGNLEEIQSYTSDNSKIVKQLEALAKSIMELDNSPLKQRILAVFNQTDGALISDGRTVGVESSESVGHPLQNPAGEVSTERVSQPQPLLAQPEHPQTSQFQQSSALTDLQKQENTQTTEGYLRKLETGTAFFRETFDSQNIERYMKAGSLPRETENFIERNLERLEREFAELSKENAVTKESVAEMLKSVSQGKPPVNIENDADVKRFLLTLADKSGMLKESNEKAEKFKEAVTKGAKAIAERLSLHPEEKNGARVDKAIDNIKEKLSLIAKELGSAPDSQKIRSGVEDVKENLKFLSNMKNDVFLQFPITLNGEQKQAELYVFSRKGGKSRANGQQSALLSLDLANLGHFETYVQKNERSVICQFRLEDDDIKDLVRENVSKLHKALKEKNYSLDGTMFMKTGEKFSLANVEPDINESAVLKTKGKLCSFDLRT